MENKKIVILGAGHVGSHCAYALAASGLCEEVVLTDIVPDKAEAQALDIADSLSFAARPVRVRAGQAAECEEASLTVVAIGEPRRPGQTRLDLLDRSVELLEPLIAQLRPQHLSGPLVSITNPADIVGDYLRKSLELERWRCFSTGTLLDTARLIRVLSEETGVGRSSICAYSLGEHGDSSMVPFSAVTLGGLPFSSFGLPPERILHKTRRAGMDIIEGKGSTEFGIGRALSELAAAILRDEKRILPVSVLLEGEYGQQGVPCGVPCRIGQRGVEAIVELPLTPEEQAQLDASCAVIRTHAERAARALQAIR